MIFITVGTHEQQFNRLVEYMDEYAKNNSEEIVIQIGYSTYIPKYAKYKEFYSYNELIKYIEKARIVITHGGPSSFMSVIKSGKIPIVVPRQKQYGEHVNNHQMQFCKDVENRYGYIKLCEVNEIEDVIDSYNSKSVKIIYNNVKFCKDLQEIIIKLF